MLESCSNIDCTSRATETAYVLAYGIEIAVRVCAKDAAVLARARRAVRDAARDPERRLTFARGHLIALPAPAPELVSGD